MASDPQQGGAPQRPREELGKIGRLIEAMDRREDQLDRPLGPQTLGLQRIGQTQTADREIGAILAQPIELPFEILTLGEAHAFGQEAHLLGHELTIEERRTHLDQLHAAFALQEARERDLELRIREEADALALKGLAMMRKSALRPARSPAP
jgi:hypothetical protein